MTIFHFFNGFPFYPSFPCTTYANILSTCLKFLSVSGSGSGSSSDSGSGLIYLLVNFLRTFKTRNKFEFKLLI